MKFSIQHSNRSRKTQVVEAWAATASGWGMKVLVLTPRSQPAGWAAKRIREHRAAQGLRGAFTQTEILDESGGTVVVRSI